MSSPYSACIRVLRLLQTMLDSRIHTSNLHRGNQSLSCRPRINLSSSFFHQMASGSKARDQGQPSSFPNFKDRGPVPRRQPPTHFLCLPLHGGYYPTPPAAHKSLKTALRQFIIDETAPAEAGLSESGDKFIIPPDAFRPFDTLHLTLGVMTLATPEEIQNAISTLESLDLTKFLQSTATGDNNKLYIDLKGLEPISSSKTGVTSCNVLILPPADAPPSPSGRLYQFCEALRSHFFAKNILTPENRPLKLHATVVNTVYCKRIKTRPEPKNSGKNRDRGRRSNDGGRVQFDATDVLERYKTYVWAEGLEIDRVQICKMGAKKGEEIALDDGTVEVVGGGYEPIAEKLIE